MLRPARIFLTVAVLSSVCFAAYRFVILPHNCNVNRKRLRASTERVARLTDHFAAMRLARRNLDAASKAVQDCPHELDLYMIAAANLRALGRFPEAVEMYERALMVDRRPEIYFNLGLVELKLGRRSKAIEHLTTAAIFSNRWRTNLPPEVADEVHAGVNAFQQE